MPRLSYPVGGAPDAAVVADEYLQRIGGIPGQRVLITGYPGAHTGIGVGGITPRAAHGQAALPQVVGACQQDGIRAGPGTRRQGRKRQIVVAVLNRDRPQRSVCLQLGRVPLLRKGNLVGTGIGAHAALVLPQALVLQVQIHRPRKGVAGQRIHCQGSAIDRTRSRAGRACIGWTQRRG